MLVAEDAIPIDGVHIYELPVPQSFEPGGQRYVDIALTYDPRTQAHRLDYLASRMEFHLARGMPLDQVANVFSQMQGDLDENDEEEDGNDDRRGANVIVEQGSSRPPTPSQLGSRLCKLAPSSAIRSRGTNQLGRITFSQRLNAELHNPMYVVVRNVNRWDDVTAKQSYAMVVVLRRSDTQNAIYLELEQRLEAVVELPIEIELSI